MRSSPDILTRIAARRRRRIGDSGRATGLPAGERRRPLSARENPFLGAVSRRRGRAVIAEVKMGSPSLGELESFDPEELASVYAEHGAAALSVVVEPDFFHGGYGLLERCRTAAELPALAKEFVVDGVQLQWARDAGASAILLIAALLSREELVGAAAAARDLGLAPLVEIHDLAELEKLEGAQWELVGVNNRDLRTFEVELEHGEALVSTLPTEALKVAESGIESAADVARLRAAGYDAFLVGEALVTSPDPGQKLEELLGRAKGG